MKKKIYEKPTVAVANIEAEAFFAASNSISDSLGNQEIGGSNMLSKDNNGFDLWGDDTEE